MSPGLPKTMGTTRIKVPRIFLSSGQPALLNRLTRPAVGHPLLSPAESVVFDPSAFFGAGILRRVAAQVQ
jgi:hypothetical protein